MLDELQAVEEFEKEYGTPKAKRGFGAMDIEVQRQLASLGGIKVWKLGKAHKFTKKTAYLAGMKGGRPRK